MTALGRSQQRMDGSDVRGVPGRGEGLSLPSVPAERSFDPIRWYEEYQQLVANVVRRRIRDPHVAEDVTQMAWLRILRVGSTYDPARSKESTFVYLVARTAVTDFLRSEMRRWEKLPLAPHRGDSEAPGPEAEVPSRELTPPGIVQRGEESEALQAHLARLDPRVREMVDGVYGRGRTARELARDLGIPLGTVKSTIFRAIERLRRGRS